MSQIGGLGRLRGVAKSSPPSQGGRLAFVVTAVGTLPYLALKVQWLSGGDAGVRPGFDMHSRTLTIANLVTLVLDGVVIALAWTLSGGSGRGRCAWWRRLSGVRSG